MNKLYITLWIVAILSLMLWHYSSVVHQRNALRIDLKHSERDRLEAIQSRDAYQKQVIKQSEVIKQSQAEKEVKINENSAMRNDVVSGVRVVTIKASCPTVHTSSANTSSASPSAVLDPAVGSALFDFREKLITLESNYNLCLDQLRLDRQKNAPN